ncbi:hypothetical protein [Streptomyces sp. NPDC046685]|uniref:hypothetical protein n=1 Tax=Streptomyces sp. NPDC046685 TaxID=3157202 RepID=UPI0033E6BCE5
MWTRCWRRRPQTLNGYTYAANNPATLSDPSGASIMDWLLDYLFSGPGGFWGAIKRGIRLYKDVKEGRAHLQVTPGKQTCYYAMGTGGCSTSKPQYKLVNGAAAPVKEREKAYTGGYPACAECMKEQGNPEVVKELLILGCSFIPILGSGCDAYDVKRSADEGDKIGSPGSRARASWQARRC